MADIVRQSILSLRKGFRSFFIRLFLKHERLFRDVAQAKARILGGSYRRWIRRHRLTEADKKAIGRHIASFGWCPLISVLMPVYNARADALHDAIRSMQAQLYPHWELSIADDASTAAHVKEIIEDFCKSDPRIRCIYRPVNGRVSAALNSALDLAGGEFIAALDQHDILSEQALYQVAAELNQHPDADIVYSDEDKVYSEQQKPSAGRRSEPHFKSGWNPDLLYSQNYISRLCVYSAVLVKSVGGFRDGLEGSQDYDLLLRCLAALDGPEVRHIPAILYHRRASSPLTALEAGEKSHATEHGIKALTDYFRSRGVADARVEAGCFPATYRVRFPVPEPPPKVSLIIPSRNHHEILRGCIDSIRGKTSYQNYEIVVIDNRSDDPATLRYLDEIARSGVRILRFDLPFNYSAINNFAAERVDGEVLGFLNNDIEVITRDWLTEMVSHAMRPDIGAVGAKLYYANDTIQHGGVILGLGGVAGHSHKHLPRDDPGYFGRLCVTQNLSAVTGACLVIRKENYFKVGGFDPANLTIAFNDVDFCLKLGAMGLRNVWTPYAELYHRESASRGREDSMEKIARLHQEMAFMKDKWGELLGRDPYYSPMLTRDWENFAPDFRAAPRKPWVDWING